MKDWQSNASWKNPAWKYRKACATDISKTFERVRREMKALEEANQAKPVVVQIRKDKTA